MATNLIDITTNYRRFIKNQVLTEGQLNEVVNYFDDQDRLSRVFLSGVGILCGFKISYDSDAKTIEISQGTAITTDGDLLKFYKEEDDHNIIQSTSNIYQFYKVYDNSEASYKPHFYDENDQFEMYELFTQTQIDASPALTEETEVLEKLTEEIIHVDELVVLLYIEEYEENKDLCVSLSCDNQGLEINSNVKVLAVSKEVALKIFENDSIGVHPNFTSSLLHILPSLHANRVLLKPSDFSDYETLKTNFSAYVIKNDIISKTLTAYHALFTVVDLPTWRNIFEEKFKELFQFENNETIPPDFQYRYDLLKDLIDTYNEIKEALITIGDNLSCAPDINAFPKHIMLGMLNNVNNSKYRHNFYKSSIFTEGKFDLARLNINTTSQNANTTEVIVDVETTLNRLNSSTNIAQATLISLVKRSLQLLVNYNANFTEIRITPSFELGTLSKKAIPFYNNVGNHLIDLWDFKKTIAHKQLYNTSYHTKYLAIKEPLSIALDSDFYRIEGHQGKNYKEVIQTLQNIRRNYNLSFNVIALKLKENSEQSKDFLHEYTEKYLQKTNGYEHKAGVVPGGTFIIVYIDSEYDAYPYPYGYGYPYYYPSTISLAGDFEDNDIEEPIKVTTPVIADFCIPYLCCDENIIDVSLPVKKLCFDAATQPLTFSVMPKNGYVEADVEEGLSGGVTVDEFGAFVFDPKLVSKELHGTPIKFTVNNFETNFSITINEKPSFSLQITNIGVPTPNKTITVTFKIIPENNTNKEYTWFFGDDNEITSDSLTIKHQYQLKEAIFKTSVKVITNNNGCIFTAEQPLLLEIPEVTLSLPEDKLCFNKKTIPLPFKVEPTNGIVKAIVEKEQNGGVVVLDKAAFFDPNSVSKELYGKEIQFTVNDFPTDCTIIITPKPVFSFTIDKIGKPSDGFVAVSFKIISDEDFPAKEFIWNFGDGEKETTEKLEITHNYNVKEQSKFTVILTGTNDNCSDTVSQVITLDISEEVDLTLSITQLCFDASTKPIQLFTVFPSEGEVATVEERVRASVQNLDGTYFFNPLLVPEEFYGEEITFSVNGLPTDASIIIFPKPTFSFQEVDRRIVEGFIEISFEVDQNPVIEGTEFTWNFGDETALEVTKEREITHQYSVFKELEEVAISVKAKAGECSVENEIIISLVSENENLCLEGVEQYNDIFEKEFEEIKPFAEKSSNKNIITLSSFYGETINETRSLEEELANGNTNEIDFEKYLRQGIFSAFTTTLSQLETDEDKLIVRFLAEANITLLYLLWCCMLKRNKELETTDITSMEKNMQKFLITAKSLEFDVDPDPENRLEAFLDIVLGNCGDDEIINSSIKDTINNLNFDFEQ